MVLVLELRTLSIVKEGCRSSVVRFWAQVNLPIHQAAAHLPVLVKKRPPENLSHTSYLPKPIIVYDRKTGHSTNYFQQRSLFITAKQ
ncbi:hypothetical protein DFS34DRAFT_652159 [Phlyctochytrium arcticum]|nr:hypothetical protein DFS34DRAFT_652159 [Phlyctochytrium arcticum]